jgi:hypothetical protein
MTAEVVKRLLRSTNYVVNSNRKTKRKEKSKIVEKESDLEFGETLEWGLLKPDPAETLTLHATRLCIP